MNTREGVPAVEYDWELSYVARRYSKKMHDEEFFGHVSPEGNDGGDQLEAYNLADDYSYWAENLYTRGIGAIYTVEALAENIVGAWEESDGHRENMRASRMTHEGVGVYMAENGFKATQLLVEAAVEDGE